LLNKNSGLLEQIEKGLITPDQFILELRRLIKQKFTDGEFYFAWNAILLEYHPERIEYIQALKSSHRLFLLSNTNQIHFDTFSKKLWGEYDLTFNNLFTKTYVSHEMGKIKPEKAIYEQVLSEQNLKPERTLFIEDTPENAYAAEELGIKTLVVPRNGMFFEYLKK
jgi:putative hydrolase of the HAD superfamily